jgi:hypothetical protein
VMPIRSAPRYLPACHEKVKIRRLLMSKDKRTFHSEVLASSSLRLQKTEPAQQKQLDQLKQEAAQRQYFAPELINRLAEKIKKL